MIKKIVLSRASIVKMTLYNALKESCLVMGIAKISIIEQNHSYRSRCHIHLFIPLMILGILPTSQSIRSNDLAKNTLMPALQALQEFFASPRFAIAPRATEVFPFYKYVSMYISIFYQGRSLSRTFRVLKRK
jgi:hypothetical protein